LRAPVNTLESNWAYMVIVALAGIPQEKWTGG